VIWALDEEFTEVWKSMYLSFFCLKEDTVYSRFFLLCLTSLEGQLGFVLDPICGLVRNSQRAQFPHSWLEEVGLFTLGAPFMELVITNQINR